MRKRHSTATCSSVASLVSANQIEKSPTYLNSQAEVLRKLVMVDHPDSIARSMSVRRCSMISMASSARKLVVFSRRIWLGEVEMSAQPARRRRYDVVSMDLFLVVLWSRAHQMWNMGTCLESVLTSHYQT